MHERHGHLQEVIVQNFRAKPGTRMAEHAPSRALEELLWTIAAARLLLPDDVAVQAPPNLPTRTSRGCSMPASTTGAASRRSRSTTSTPRRRGPTATACAAATRVARARARAAAARLPALPLRRRGSTRPCCRPCCAPRTRSGSRARTAGTRARPGSVPFVVARDALPVDTADELGEDELVRLFRARGDERAPRASPPPTGSAARSAATRSATSSRGTSSTRTSATSAAASAPSRRGSWRRTCAARRTSSRTRRSSAAAREAWERGATEVCLQGGIHPAFTGDYYASVVEAIKDASCPELHIHAFSALEVWQGAETLGLPLEEYLARLRVAGSRLAAGDGGRDPRRRGAGASSAPTRSRPSSGSRCTTPRTASASART